MTLARRTAVGFAALATTVLPVACSGGDSDADSDRAMTAAADTSAASDIGHPIRLTLTESAVATSAAPENQSSRFAGTGGA